MAIAAQRRGENRRVVAVIGDGAMSAGMAFEALNNAGTAHADLLVVLNDNEMSISEPVGALNGYLASLLSSRFYNTMRRGSKEVLSKVPPVKELAKRWEEHMNACARRCGQRSAIAATKPSGRSAHRCRSDRS